MDDAPTILVYHARCLDGAKAVWNILSVLDRDIMLVAAEHPADEALRARIEDHARLAGNGRSSRSNLLVVDYSFTPQITRHFAGLYRHVTVLDHHDTAIARYRAAAEMPGNVRLVLDQTRCGAQLAYDEVVRKVDPAAALPSLLPFVQMLDLGLTEMPDYHAVEGFMDYAVNASTLEGAFSGFRRAEARVNQCLVPDPVRRDRKLRRLYQEGARRHAEFRAVAEDLLRTSDVTPLWLPGGEEPSLVPIIHGNVRGPGGRVLGDKASECAGQSSAGVVLLWTQHKDVVHVSVRTNGEPHAGEVAEFLGSFGLDGGGGRKIACAHFTAQDFHERFPRFQAGEVSAPAQLESWACVWARRPTEKHPRRSFTCES